MTASRIVDLRSDTVTRPTPAMRRAIAEAEVGDDVLGDDPTVQRLERAIADRLGKEAALFFPSGIMANQTAVQVLAEPGGEVVIEAEGHILNYEAGAAARWAGVQMRPVAAPDNLMTAELVRAAARPPGRYSVKTTLVCLENTHNAGGGRVLALDAMRAIRATCAELGLPIHLDGARLWNASVASGVPERDYAALADTVMVTLSKGLGCPIGSMLAGTAETMDRAWHIRRRLGGGMRQAGILAAAGLHALEHHRDRLADDHANARLLASLAARIDGVRVVEPQTNIVMIDLPATGPDAAAAASGLADQGVLVSEFGPRRLRAVTHLDVDEDGVRAAAAALARVFE
ncbi:MAG TPA: GntG family PLP-dependent aldolase [Longimicrobiales bacterium]|nr:GntG family PLP-dependent aldolase [Longimicrobiales bacterium]